MDTTASQFQDTGNIKAIASRSSNSICKFKKAMAIEAYQRVEGCAAPPRVQSDGKIVQAVKRWTAHDDVRIEFYTAKGLRGIRVKVIKNDAGGKTCDMSLATFMGSSPTTI